MPVSTILVLLALLFMSAVFHVLPEFTRPGLFFAVTVLPDFRRTPDARRILGRFRAMVWICALVAGAVEIATGLFLIAVLIQVAGLLAALVTAHRRAAAFAAPLSSSVEVNLAAPSEGLPGGSIMVWLPIAALFALGIWTNLNFERLPRSFPVHWGFEGPDRWVTTTHASVFGFLALEALLCALLAGSAWALLNWSRRIATSGPSAAPERRFRRRLVQLIIVIEYFVVFPAWFALFQPASALLTVWGVALAITLVAFIASLIRAGQGGSREAAAAGAPVGDRTPDACWKWGLFYVNPADPSLLIEKRFGIGYTINLGNRWAWLLLVLILAPLAVGLLFLRA